jgi:hypothetical protein
MDDENRIVDHSPILGAARQDAGREGARMVYMTVGELWRMIHQAPAIAITSERLAGATKAR